MWILVWIAGVAVSCLLARRVYSKSGDGIFLSSAVVLFGFIFGFGATGIGDNAVIVEEVPLVALDSGNYLAMDGVDSWTYRVGEREYETVEHIVIAEAPEGVEPTLFRIRGCTTMLPFWTLCGGDAGEGQDGIAIPADSVEVNY